MEGDLLGRFRDGLFHKYEEQREHRPGAELLQIAGCSLLGPWNLPRYARGSKVEFWRLPFFVGEEIDELWIGMGT